MHVHGTFLFPGSFPCSYNSLSNSLSTSTSFIYGHPFSMLFIS